MRPSWKLALIGGEVTVLAAFTGVGIHLAMQPHHAAFRPPTLPSLRPAVIPTLTAPLAPPVATTTASSAQPALGPELLRKLGQQDRNLLGDQWDVLQRLTRAIERYVEDRLSEPLEGKR